MTNRKLRREVAMPLLAADPVIVEPAQREALEALLRAHSTSQQLALRIRIILQAADDVGVRESARELAVWPKTVRYWRGRWRQAPPTQSVPERLADAPRSGAPATYTPEQSVGVGRQYCGELGKQDNCQIAVTLSIANHHASLPVAYRLYLPKEWATDRA